MCDVLNTTAKQPSGLRCKDKMKSGGVRVSWKRVPSVGLDWHLRPIKEISFHMGLKRHQLCGWTTT